MLSRVFTGFWHYCSHCNSIWEVSTSKAFLAGKNNYKMKIDIERGDITEFDAFEFGEVNEVEISSVYILDTF